MNEQDKITRLEKRLVREKMARQEAERLLEQKSLSLYESNKHLSALSNELEVKVKLRTEELTEALKQSEAGMRSRQQFLALMSHEIRTPLHGMLGLIDLLILSPLNAEQAEHTGIIRSSGRSLLRLLNDILELSRIDSEAFEIELETIDLNSVIAGIAQLYGSLAHTKNLQLIVEQQPQLPSQLLGDESRIRQILTNLLSNAVKFTHQGSISLHTGATKTKDGRWNIQIIVKDTGIGIELDKIPTLFHEFTQANADIHKQFGGTGLGLSISRKLVELMGGRLVVRSQLGQGSEFELNIVLDEAPRLDSEPRPIQTPLSELRDKSKYDKLHVLVVDDNLVNRTLLASFLKRLGIESDLACDGQEALEAVKTQGPFDLVFMDLVMPYMDGLETTQKIRQLSINQPFICGLSANAFKTDQEKCLTEGMNDFLQKPLSFDKFCQFMHHVMPAANLKV